MPRRFLQTVTDGFLGGIFQTSSYKTRKPIRSRVSLLQRFCVGERPRTSTVGHKADLAGIKDSVCFLHEPTCSMARVWLKVCITRRDRGPRLGSGSAALVQATGTRRPSKFQVPYTVLVPPPEKLSVELETDPGDQQPN